MTPPVPDDPATLVRVRRIVTSWLKRSGGLPRYDPYEFVWPALVAVGRLPNRDSALVGTAVVRECLDELERLTRSRRKRGARTFTDEAAADNPGPAFGEVADRSPRPWERAEAAEAAAAAWARVRAAVPPRERLWMRLVFSEGWTRREVAQAWDVHEDTVRFAFYRWVPVAAETARAGE